MKHEAKRGLFRPQRTVRSIPIRENIVAPPAVVSQYCAKPESDGTGVCARCMFPKVGTVGNIRIFIDSLKGDETALLRIGPLDGPGDATQVEVKAGVNQIEGRFAVADGDRLKIEVIKPQVTGVWISFLYQT